MIECPDRNQLKGKRVSFGSQFERIHGSSQEDPVAGREHMAGGGGGGGSRKLIDHIVPTLREQKVSKAHPP